MTSPRPCSPRSSHQSMTEMVYKRVPELREQRQKRFPIKREVLPQEVAGLVLYLCSDEARYINGVGIPIDGSFLNSGFYQAPES